MGLLLVRLGTLALIQYNKLARCLLVNRPKPFFRHVRLSWQNECRGTKSVVVAWESYCTYTYVLRYDLVEFLSYLSQENIQPAVAADKRPL